MPTHKSIREILEDYSRELLTEHFGSEIVGKDFGCKECIEYLMEAKSEILELQKQELALKCAGIEEFIKQFVLDLDDERIMNTDGAIIYDKDWKDLATKLTEWMGQ